MARGKAWPVLVPVICLFLLNTVRAQRPSHVPGPGRGPKPERTNLAITDLPQVSAPAPWPRPGFPAAKVPPGQNPPPSLAAQKPRVPALPTGIARELPQDRPQPTARELLLAPPANDLTTPSAEPRWTGQEDLPAGPSAELSFSVPEELFVCYQPPTVYDRLLRAGETAVDETFDMFDRMICDYRNFYSGKGLAYLGLAVALAAPLANTAADRSIRDWYQEQARSPASDRWARFGNDIGKYEYAVPVYLGGWIAGKALENTYAGGLSYGWSTRTLRGLAVGAPAVGLLQWGLGAGRPEEGSSRWRPFHDTNAVAGHTFVGGLPFLAAASLTENKLLKGAFFAGSFWSAWSRVHYDAHYFSQAFLGWSIAYLSMRSVVQTDFDRQALIEFVPVESPDGGTGVGVLIRY